MIESSNVGGLLLLLTKSGLFCLNWFLKKAQNIFDIIKRFEKLNKKKKRIQLHNFCREVGV